MADRYGPSVIVGITASQTVKAGPTNYALTTVSGSWVIGPTTVFTTVAESIYRIFDGAGTAVASGFGNPSVRIRLSGSGQATANGFALATGRWTLNSGATGVASAYGTFIKDLSSGATGVASAVGQIDVITIYGGSGTAVATAYGNLSLTQGIAGNARATANARGNLSLYEFVQNRILSGELIDQSNQSTFQFRVGGNLINLSSTNKYILGDLIVDYTGSSLSWTEITTTDVGSPSFDLNATVQLDLDFGHDHGVERVFTGRIRQRDATATNNDHFFNYVAESTQRLANELTLVNTNGRPEFEWTIGTTVVTSSATTGTEVTTTFAYTLRDAVQDVFTVMASALANESIPATIGVPGLDQLTVDLQETTDLTNTNFVDGVEQLLSIQPGIKLFFNERQQAWTLVNLNNLPSAIADVSSIQITEGQFDKNVNDRYTAVRLIADAEEFIDNALVNGAYPFVRHEVTLEPNWVTDLQGSWNLYLALNDTALAGPYENPYYWIYRKFKVPASALEPIFGFPIQVQQKKKIFENYRYRAVNGKLTWKYREWVARDILIDKGNPHLGGEFVVPPGEVTMTYYPIQGMSYITTVTSGTGVATIITSAPLSDFASEVRMPPTGFEGTAYTEAGISRELVQIVSGTEATTENAQAMLDHHKNIVVTGTLPFAGDMLRTGVWLSQQIYVQHATRRTGIESVAGIITGYTYTFGRPGETRLELSTEASGVLGNG